MNNVDDNLFRFGFALLLFGTYFGIMFAVFSIFCEPLKNSWFLTIILIPTLSAGLLFTLLGPTHEY
jgi:hypothetical protein